MRFRAGDLENAQVRHVPTINRPTGRRAERHQLLDNLFRPFELIFSIIPSTRLIHCFCLFDLFAFGTKCS